MKKTCFLLFALLATPAFALIRYVDNAATGLNNGTSWANAWTHPTAINGVGGGDTVYISGGTTSKTYNFSSGWDVPNGSSGNPLTIMNGRDAGHTGMVIFNNTAGADVHITELHWVTMDFAPLGHNALPSAGSTRLRFTSPNSRGVNILNAEAPNYSNGMKLFGIEFNWRLQSYDARDVEVAGCIFNYETPGRRLTGGPGWIIGLGRADQRGYGYNSFHHNRVNLMYTLTPWLFNGENGDDGMQNCGGSGGNIDIYNNEFISTHQPGDIWAGDNHQDGIQCDPGYGRVWNNYFENMANYCLFGEHKALYDVKGWQVWNNVFNYTDPQLTINPTCAVAIGNKDGSSASNINYINIAVFNNTIRGGKQGIAIGVQGWTQTLNNVRVQNNVLLGSGGIFKYGTETGGTVFSNNPSAASNWFVNVASNNFHLTSNAVGAIGQATTSGGFFPTITTTDKDGVARGAVWDIGAYEFAASAGPGSVAFSTVPFSVAEGAGNLSVTVNRVDGTAGAIGVAYATSNGSASAGSDYTSTSGTLSWADGDGAAKSFNVPITSDAASEGNEDFTITLSSPTGGATIIGVTSGTATIIDDDSAPTVPLMSGLTFAANLGLIEAPFSAAGAVVSQSIDTGPTNGGRARYRVTIPTTGDYSMTMNMNCTSTGTDSIYVTWDGEPLEPGDVFDVGVTTGTQTKTVTRRGTGGPATPQFNPWFKNLTAGVHELTVRGREPSAQFSSITVVAAPVTDTTAPTPNPPTWELPPIAPVDTFGQTTITMRVAPVSDPSTPVEYFFDETSGGPGASDSGWQQSVDYADNGLTPNTSYTYQVKARDSIGNETTFSDAVSETTNQVLSGSTTINATNLTISLPVFPEYKKIIHWQSFSESPSVTNIVTNSAYIDTLPFDGLVIKYPDHQLISWSDYVASYATLYSQIGPIKDVLSNVVNNYALVQTGNAGMVDPFDDWTQTQANWVIFAQVCRDAGLKGIFLDVEEYGVHWWTYPTDCKYGGTKTLTEYRDQWRFRGKQLMQAIIAQWPEVKILVPHDPLFSSTTYGSPNWMGGWFSMGLFEGAPGHMISGGEHYQERNSGDFLQWYNYSLNELTEAPDSPALIPFSLTGTWRALYNRSFGIYDADTTGTPDMTYSVLQTTITNAMPYCTELLWNYSDFPDWLTPGAGTAGNWQDAVWAARSALGLPPPGS